jgi:hypothetical protein
MPAKAGMTIHLFVIPAKAGISVLLSAPFEPEEGSEIPAFAGMTI